MIFFRNANIRKVINEHSKNEIGQVVSKNKIDDKEYNVNIQPIENSTKSKIWGETIKSTYNMYIEKNIVKAGDFIYWNNESYKVEKIIMWNTYDIAALKKEGIKIDVI